MMINTIKINPPGMLSIHHWNSSGPFEELPLLLSFLPSSLPSPSGVGVMSSVSAGVGVISESTGVGVISESTGVGAGVAVGEGVGVASGVGVGSGVGVDVAVGSGVGVFVGVGVAVGFGVSFRISSCV